MADNISTTKKRYGWSIKIAVLCIIACEYTIAVTNAGLGAIAVAFPDADTQLIRMIQTLPGLTMVPIALLVPVFEKFILKKRLIIIAAILMIIAGVAPGFGGDLNLILVCRAVYGMSRGIIFPMAMSFILELFDGKERDEMMGFRSATGNIMSLAFLNLGGFLAGMFWRYTFFGVLLMLPLVIYIIVKLPNPEKENEDYYKRLEEKRLAQKESKGSVESKLTPKSWAFILGNLGIMCFIYCFLTDVSINIVPTGLGTPVTVSTIMTTFTCFSIIMGLSFGKIIRPLFKRFSMPLGLVLIAIAFWIIQANGASLTNWYAGAAFFGLGFAVYNTAIYLDLAKSSHPTAAATAMSMHMAFTAVGWFAAAFVVQFVGGFIGITGELRGFIIGAPVVTAIALLIIIVKAIKKPKEDFEDLAAKEVGGKGGE